MWTPQGDCSVSLGEVVARRLKGIIWTEMKYTQQSLFMPNEFGYQEHVRCMKLALEL